MNDPVPAVGTWLTLVLRGYYQYYGVPRNRPAMQAFRTEVRRCWKRMLGRRSQKGYITWARMIRLADHWLPYPRIIHPYPSSRDRLT